MSALKSLVESYASDEEENESKPSSALILTKTSNQAMTVKEAKSNALSKILSSDVIPSYAVLPQEAIGPTLPGMKDALTSALQKQHLSGKVESAGMTVLDFDQQYHRFQREGITQDPSAVTASTISLPNHVPKSIQQRKEERIAKLGKREARGDPADIENYRGPWAGYERDQVGQPVGPDETMRAQAAALLAQESNELLEQTVDTEQLPAPDEETVAGMKFVQSQVKKRKLEAKARKALEATTLAPGHETSQLHISSMDYLGRSYLHAPVELERKMSSVQAAMENETLQCFLPKRVVHTFNGHVRGVNAITLFPQSAHLLLSAGMDCTVKLWQVYQQRHLLRTFIGHSKAVRHVAFDGTGHQFLSCSYDKYFKLWDTETGQCKSQWTRGHIPFQAQFHPTEQTFLVACGDKKIYQFDSRMSSDASPIQEYTEHVDAVNTVTFIDQGRRFISTSDDKSIRIWETGMPVSIKYMADPSMHAIPSMTLSYNGKWLAAQSLDNQILMYSVADKMRQQPKKRFAGHLLAGHACQPAISPDNRYVASGDSEGHLNVWDWKTGRIVKRIKEHDQVTLGCLWHPLETSKVFTCSWDSTIKLWD